MKFSSSEDQGSFVLISFGSRRKEGQRRRFPSVSFTLVVNLADNLTQASHRGVRTTGSVSAETPANNERLSAALKNNTLSLQHHTILLSSSSSSSELHPHHHHH